MVNHASSFQLLQAFPNDISMVANHIVPGNEQLEGTGIQAVGSVLKDIIVRVVVKNEAC